MKNHVDLLLINPPSRKKVYQSLSNEYAALEPPVWAGLIATFIRTHHYSVQILDAEAEDFTTEQTAKKITDLSPKLAVFCVYGQQPSASTQCMPGAREVALLIKESGLEIPMLVLGTHASSLPKKTLEEEPYQYVCQGEGPYTILALLENLKSKTKNLSKVPGLWYYDQSDIKHTPTAHLIKDLDQELPQQAWDLLDMSKYKAHNWHCFDHIEQRQPYASLQTSLGCPFRCSFCCINAPFGKPGIRYWSPENVIAQIDILVQKYNVKNIKIPDELFVLHDKHVNGICDLIIDRGYDLNIWAYARVDTIKEHFLEKLKKAGIQWVALGIESGSKYVRDGVDKGRFVDGDITKVVRQIQNAGLYIVGNYIFGLPDDTEATMQETLDLAKDLNTEWGNFYCAMAYPGSALYKMAIEKNWKLPADWIGYSQHAFETLPLPTNALSGPEVLAFRDNAFTDYFTNPQYLSMVEGKFGKPVKEHVLKMTQHQIQRKFKA